MQADYIITLIMRKQSIQTACAYLTMMLMTTHLVANPASPTKNPEQLAGDIGREDLVASDKKMQAFLKKSGQDKELEKVKQAEPNSNSSTEKTPATKSDNTDAIAQTNTTDKKDETTEKPPTTIKIDCDGGFYFDNDSGIVAYLKNIRLDASDSSFKLRCSDELKVVFDNMPEEKKKPSEKEKQKQNDKEKAAPSTQKDTSFAELGNLKEIIATGNVRIAGENSEGQPFLASGHVASYNAKTGKMILKGGQPTLQWDANQYLQAQEEGLWITIQMRNKTIENITTSEGKWTTRAVIKKNPLE